MNRKLTEQDFIQWEFKDNELSQEQAVRNGKFEFKMFLYNNRYMIGSYSEYEIDQMQRTVMKTISLLHKKEIELNRQGVLIN